MATAADGLEALDKAFELLPDVILMDLSLPGIDGWEATRRLKQDDRTRDIPIIALTAHALAAAHDKAREVGCNAVVTKPCLPKDLELEVRRQLDALTRLRERRSSMSKADKTGGPRRRPRKRAGPRLPRAEAPKTRGQ